MISVAMATYNGEKYIRKQIESIYKQSYPVDEVIICDDQSNDNTVKIINRFIYENHLSKKWKVVVNEKQLGFVKNFIKAISLTTGEFVFLSDQDDIFYQNKFQVMMDFFRNNPQCILLNANYEIIDENGRVSENFRSRSRKKRKHCVEQIEFREWLFESAFPGFSMGFRACIREKIVNSNIEDCYGHDQIIGLIAIDQKGNYRMGDVLSGYRIHYKNTTGGINVMSNYSISKRIEQKEKERTEYKRMENLIKKNGIQNIDYEFFSQREKELEKRIKLLKERNLWGEVLLLFKAKTYPKGTIMGDCICLIRGIS